MSDRLDHKLLQLRRLLLVQVVYLAALIVAAIVWWRGEEMGSVRARALEAATVSFQSDVVQAIGNLVLLSTGIAGMVLLTLLPCIHVVRAMHGFVLDATQRRVADEQVAAAAPGRKA